MAGQTSSCRCGAIRLTIAGDAQECGWCHCDTCRKASGAPASAFASYRLVDVRVANGAADIRRERTSSFAERWWCGRCGTPIAIDYDCQPEWIDLAVGTLDDPSRVPPTFHIFWSRKVPWLDPADGLPRFDGFRPGSALAAQSAP